MDKKENTSENKKQEELKKDIKKSIEKIKKRDEKVWPEKKYIELVLKKKPLDKNAIKKEQKKKKIIESTAIYMILSLLLIIILILTYQLIMIGNPETEQPAEPIIAEEGCQIINDIEFKIVDYYIEGNTLFVQLNVFNKSKNNFYTTVRSMYLIDKDGKEYLPNVGKGVIPTDFYGKTIEPQTRVNALIAFDGITQMNNKSTLIISNVSDSYHFIWDYMITLPEK